MSGGLKKLGAGCEVFEENLDCSIGKHCDKLY
jgi:hypothetical protein